jgi:hypothetical protein
MGMALPQKLTRKPMTLARAAPEPERSASSSIFIPRKVREKLARQRRSGPALRNAPYIFKLSTEVDFVFDNMLEVSAIGREHHLNPEGSLAFKGPLPNDTLDLLLRCYTNVLQEFAQ